MKMEVKIEKVDKKSELDTLKKTGLKWGVLTCLYEALRKEKRELPNKTVHNLEVARCIIETGCRKLACAESLLNETKNTLLANTRDIPNTNCWKKYIEKAERGELTPEEAMNVPFMKEVVRKYEFLSYCL